MTDTGKSLTFKKIFKHLQLFRNWTNWYKKKWPKKDFGPIVRHTQGRSISKVKIIGSGSVAVWGATKGRGHGGGGSIALCADWRRLPLLIQMTLLSFMQQLQLVWSQEVKSSFSNVTHVRVIGYYYLKTRHSKALASRPGGTVFQS